MNLYVTVPIEEKLDTTDLTQTKTSFICKALDVTLEKKLETFTIFQNLSLCSGLFPGLENLLGKFQDFFQNSRLCTNLKKSSQVSIARSTLLSFYIFHIPFSLCTLLCLLNILTGGCLMKCILKLSVASLASIVAITSAKTTQSNLWRITSTLISSQSFSIFSVDDFRSFLCMPPHRLSLFSILLFR